MEMVCGYGLRTSCWLLLSCIHLRVDGSKLQFDVSVSLEGRDSFSSDYWRRSFGSGHASLALRSDWRAALGRAAQDVGLEGVRQHGIFDDDMHVIRMLDGQIVYNWTSIDILWDAHVSRGLRPVVELDFMPWLLANCSSAVAPHPELPPCAAPGGWVKTGSQGPPRNWSDWYDLVRATVSHAVSRYGLKEVRLWDFEVWNELWGMSEHNFESLGQYMTLYNHTARAVKSVSGELRVGGPATAGLALIDEFLAGCESEHIPYDFVSSHSYPTDFWGNPNGGTCPEEGFYWDPYCFINNVRSARNRVPAGKSFYLTEYNIGCCEPYKFHDTNPAAAFVFWVVPKLSGIVDIASYWTFSDIFVEDCPMDPSALCRVEFGNFYGIETVSGISKPVRRAFELLHVFAGHQRLNVSIAASQADTVGAEGCVVQHELGCFNQQKSKDNCWPSVDNGGSVINRTSLDLKACLDFCWRQGAADSGSGEGLGGPVSFVGLEAGRECWCSSKPLLSNGSCPLVPASQCNASCPGQANESCGGPWRLRAFAVKCAPPAPARVKPEQYVSAFATSDGGANLTVFLSTWDERAGTPHDNPNGTDIDCIPDDVSCTRSITLSLPSGACGGGAMLHRIDHESANPKSAWVSMGSPRKPNAEQLQRLMDASVVPITPLAPASNGKFVFAMPPNGAYMVWCRSSGVEQLRSVVELATSASESSFQVIT